MDNAVRYRRQFTPLRPCSHRVKLPLSTASVVGHVVPINAEREGRKVMLYISIFKVARLNPYKIAPDCTFSGVAVQPLDYRLL